MAEKSLTQAEKRPLIGITCHVDGGGPDELFPGRALHYIDRTYADALIANGMLPVIVPVNRDGDYIDGVLKAIDGMVCTGGGKIAQHILDREEIPCLAETAPERYRFERELLIRALALDLPLLGMCRSMQTLNELLGGTMYAKLAVDVPGAMEHNQTKLGVALREPYHEIAIAADSHLARITGTKKIRVNSWHSQGVCSPGRGLKVTAWSADRVVEALESECHTFVLMTQFHPEIMVQSDFYHSFFHELKTQAVLYRRVRKGEADR